MKLITTLTSMAVFSMLTATSQATIYWDFAQEGNNVRLTCSGSLNTAITGSRFIPQTDAPGPLLTSFKYNSTAINTESVLSLALNENWLPPANFTNDSYFKPNLSNPFLSANLDIDTRTQISGLWIQLSFVRSSGSAQIYWDQSLGISLTPGENINNSSLFANTTLADFGLNGSTAPTALFVPISNPTDLGNSIVVRVPVPEPSSSLLSILGGLFFISRRKR